MQAGSPQSACQICPPINQSIYTTKTDSKGARHTHTHRGLGSETEDDGDANSDVFIGINMENISKDNKTKKEDKHLLDSYSKLSQEQKSMSFTYKSLNTELEELGPCRQTNLFHMMAAPKSRLKRNEGGLETGRPHQGPLTHFFCKSRDLQKAEQQCMLKLQAPQEARRKEASIQSPWQTVNQSINAFISTFKNNTG